MVAHAFRAVVGTDNMLLRNTLTFRLVHTAHVDGVGAAITFQQHRPHLVVAYVTKVLWAAELGLGQRRRGGR